MTVQSYSYNDLDIGLTHSFTTVVTTEKQAAFCELSGDVNPLHCDEAFAQKKGFSGVVVYGMLVASFYSTLAGCYIPGKHCLLHSVETKMVKPVFIGDTLTITGTLKEKNDLFNQIMIKAAVKNQNGEIVSRAIIKAGCLDE